MRGCIVGGWVVLLGVVLCGLVGVVVVVEVDVFVFDLWVVDVLGLEMFLVLYLDMCYCKLGNEVMQGGWFEQVWSYYWWGVCYVDKLLQVVLVELLWNGVGGLVDCVVVYVWMDLVVECGDCFLLVYCECYWVVLDLVECDWVLVEGQVLYDIYGDVVVKLCQECEMCCGCNEVMGSWLGWIGVLKMIVCGEDGQQQVMLVDCFLQDCYWELVQYWYWQVQVMEQMQCVGMVEVGLVIGVLLVE